MPSKVIKILFNRRKEGGFERELLLTANGTLINLMIAVLVWAAVEAMQMSSGNFQVPVSYLLADISVRMHFDQFIIIIIDYLQH